MRTMPFPPTPRRPGSPWGASTAPDPSCWGHTPPTRSPSWKRSTRGGRRTRWGIILGARANRITSFRIRGVRWAAACRVTSTTPPPRWSAVPSNISWNSSRPSPVRRARLSWDSNCTRINMCSRRRRRSTDRFTSKISPSTNSHSSSSSRFTTNSSSRRRRRRRRATTRTTGPPSSRRTSTSCKTPSHSSRPSTTSAPLPPSTASSTIRPPSSSTSSTACRRTTSFCLTSRSPPRRRCMDSPSTFP
mmetsp:Transcript_44861/g.95484  ORF Transcript_44861/g.95484 Transcript_44861/m.95484 type:complete len:246 (+) Transcript_44861:796-1533(+)